MRGIRDVREKKIEKKTTSQEKKNWIQNKKNNEKKEK